MRCPPAAVESDRRVQLPLTVTASVAYITTSAAAPTGRSVAMPATHASPPTSIHRIHERFTIKPPCECAHRRLHFERTRRAHGERRTGGSDETDDAFLPGLNERQPRAVRGRAKARP